MLMNRMRYFVNRQNYGAWVLGLSLIGGLAGRSAWSQFLRPATVATVSSSLAVSRGCHDDPTGLSRLLPEWVSVRPADTPAIAEGVVRASHVSSEEAPNSHFSHDQNFDVALDPASAGFNSEANPVENNERLMEIEWETKFFPTAFWPAPGDRVWMMGRWVFDCGHPPYRTEFHPPIAVAFTHLEPVIFPGDTTPILANRTSIY